MQVKNHSSPNIISSHKINYSQKITHTLKNILAKICGIKNSDVNLKTQPYKFTKIFSNNYDTVLQRKDQTGYLSHFGPKQEPAIFIHSSGPYGAKPQSFAYTKAITLDDKDHTGKPANYSLLSVRDFVTTIKKDFNLDLRRTGNTGQAPLHLVCCYSGGTHPDSLAGQLARELERSVVCYGDNKQVVISNDLRSNLKENARVYNYHPDMRNTFDRPLYEIIHFPDNKPGQIRR